MRCYNKICAQILVHRSINIYEILSLQNCVALKNVRFMFILNDNNGFNYLIFFNDFDINNTFKCNDRKNIT